MKKRLIAALLSLCMLLGMAPLSALAAQPVYVALGDSISTGYGLNTETAEKSFVEQIAEQQELSMTMRAADGETTASLLGKLEDTDGEVAKALEKADVVTLTIGGNDFMNALYEYMAGAYNQANSTSFTAEQFKEALEGKNEDLEQATALAFVTQKISGFAPGASTLLTQFETALNKIASGIRGYTEAPVVVATQYNPYRFAADEVSGEPATAAQAIADAFDAMLALMNAKIKALEAQEGFFTADVFSVFDGAQQNPCNASFLSSNLDFHPNAHGHTLMAQTVGEVVQSALSGGTAESTDITVGGVTLSYVDAPVYASTDGDGKVTSLGKNEEGAPWNIEWDGSTLTLDGAVIAAPAGASEAIAFAGDLEIWLTKQDSSVAGTVQAGGSLKVMGDAGLEITGGERSQAVSTENTPAGQSSTLTVKPIGEGAMAVWQGEDADTAEELYYSPFISEKEAKVSGRYVRFEFKEYPFVLPERLVYDKNSLNDLFLGLYLGEREVSSLSLGEEELTPEEEYEILSISSSLALKRDFVDGLETGEYPLTLTLSDDSSVTVPLTVPETCLLTIETEPGEGGSCELVEYVNGVEWRESIDGTYYAVVGEEIKLLALPNLDYSFVQWEKDGEVVTDSQRYIFTPQDDCTLTMVFKEEYYELQADPASVSFGSVTPGYAQPEAKTVTITNKSNEWVSLEYLSEPENFEITWPEEPEWREMLGLDPDETLSFQVVPKAGLDVGRYSETFTVYANLMLQPRAMSALTERSAEEEGYLWNTKVEIELSFTVRNRSNGSGGGGGPVSYTLSFETGEGSKVDSVTKVSGTTVDLDDYVSSREGYEFTGWYNDREATQKIGSVTLRGDKTVYAGWEKAGGEKASFDDVLPGHWAYEAVEYVNEKGLMSGVGGGSFSPGQPTTRGMLVTILYRLEGEPELEGTGTIRFSDVEDDAWYAKGVYWAAENGIVKGVGDGRYLPEDPVTREQMAAIFHRYAGYKDYDVTAQGDLSAFTDAASVGDWAREALIWAVDKELINGMGDGTVNPRGTATRAQTAAILMRFCETVAKPQQ